MSDGQGKGKIQPPPSPQICNFDKLPSANTKYICKTIVLVFIIVAFAFILYVYSSDILKKFLPLITGGAITGFFAGLAIYPPIIWIIKKFNE